MAWYVLKFGNTVLGDELVVPSGSFAVKQPSLAVDYPGQNVQETFPYSAQLLLRPSFQVRKHAESMWHFEQWLFDLACWADGRQRDLEVADQDDNLIAHYGLCVLAQVRRPSIQTPEHARYSNHVILTFQAGDVPQFYLT